jgi:DNA invertase Pin-like site-specific DNA recombinase
LAPRVFSYDRVSHSSQRSGGGLARQSALAADWCSRHGCKLDTQLTLSDPGRSAFKGHHIKRGALGKFIALAQQGQLGPEPVLLVEALDRVSRLEPLDALDDLLLELVKRCGVRLITLEDGQEYSRSTLRDDPMALVKLALLTQASHQYSARLSRRMSAHWGQVRTAQDNGKRVVRGRGGMKPFWLDADSATDEWRLNDLAPGVARLFQLLETDGLLATADRLNQQGMPGPKGKPWDVSSVRRVATDPSAMGTLQRFTTAHEQSKRAHRRWVEARDAAAEAGEHFTDDEPKIRQLEIVEDYYPAVVTPEQWATVQAAMASRDRNAGGNRAAKSPGSFLQGMVTCSGGGAMGISSALIRSTGEMRKYFVCRNRRRRQPCTCSGEHWRADWVHSNTITRLGDHLLSQASIPGEDRRAELHRIQQRLDAALLLERDAAAAVAKAAAMLEQAVDAGSLALAENATGILEQRRQGARRADADVAALQQQLAMTEARALPISRLANDAGQMLVSSIARGEAGDAELLRLREVLRQSDLRVVLKGSGDNRQLGLRFGRGDDYDWAPLAGMVRNLAAHLGMTRPVVVKETANSIRIQQAPLPPEVEAEIQRLLEE